MKLGNKPNITIKRAHEILDWLNSETDLLTLQEGIDQGVYKFGTCIHCSRRVFKVSKKLFSDWVLDWSGAKLTFDGELFRITLDDGIMYEEQGEDGIVRVQFKPFENVQVAV